MKLLHFLQNNKGFAMLFTVVIISLILSISLGISNITLKQGILSGLAKDSQISFYEADAAIECALYYDITLDAFPLGSVPSGAPVSCGSTTFAADMANSAQNYFVFSDSTNTQAPCASFSIDKQASGVTIKARGYNVCNASPRKVERALQVTY